MKEMVIYRKTTFSEIFEIQKRTGICNFRIEPIPGYDLILVPLIEKEDKNAPRNG
jgi:hypothetical protein